VLESVVSLGILTEYRRVEARMLARLGRPPHPETLTSLLLASTIVPDVEGPPVTADPDDDKFMWAASTAGGVVVSGDRHLLDASGWRGVRVVTPRSFLTELDRSPD